MFGEVGVLTLVEHPARVQSPARICRSFTSMVPSPFRSRASNNPVAFVLRAERRMFTSSASTLPSAFRSPRREFGTETVTDAIWPPFETVTVVVPGPTAVISPVEFTVATAMFPERKFVFVDCLRLTEEPSENAPWTVRPTWSPVNPKLI